MHWRLTFTSTIALFPPQESGIQDDQFLRWSQRTQPQEGQGDGGILRQEIPGSLAKRRAEKDEERTR